jgi:hypothetical protein
MGSVVDRIMAPRPELRLPRRRAERVERWSVILVVFVLVAFIGIPVFLSWKRNRG